MIHHFQREQSMSTRMSTCTFVMWIKSYLFIVTKYLPVYNCYSFVSMFLFIRCNAAQHHFDWEKNSIPCANRSDRSQLKQSPQALKREFASAWPQLKCMLINNLVHSWLKMKLLFILLPLLFTALPKEILKSSSRNCWSKVQPGLEKASDNAQEESHLEDATTHREINSDSSKRFHLC